MKKTLLGITLGFIAFYGLQAQEPLKFNADGSFKIVQFTDLHYNAVKPESRIVLKRIDEVLSAESPDLVVITGDIIYSSPAKDALKNVFECVSAHGVPFCAVFGNHDADFGTSKDEMYDYIRRFPGCVMPERGGSYDYALPVLASGVADEAAGVLYFIDSNAHIFEDGKFVGYDYIKEPQIEWYKSTSVTFTAANGGSPLPSLAFFHIPLPEFHDAVKNEACTLIGTRMEPACAPQFNSGMFDAIRQMGDVFGVFVGHDHDNDYAVAYENVLFAYGRYTGGNTEYNNLPNGARVIVLKEGRRELDSYVRIKGGRILTSFTFPESFYQTPWADRPLDSECN